MPPRVAAMEEGKEKEALPARTSKSGALPVRLLMVSLLFLLVGLGFCIASMFAVKYFGIQNPISVAPIAESNIRPCYDEPSSVTSWIKPLLNLLHNMNDSELFWRASFVPRIKAYPFKRVRKIAFMFLTKGPLPLAPIWERFFNGHEGMYSIYLHSHPAYVTDFPPSSVFHQRQIPSKVLPDFNLFRVYNLVYC